MTLTREEYEAKREARYDRLLAASRKAQGESDSLIGSARSMASAIPFGQPILVGHYSEGRDRRYRGRIENKFRKGFELQQHASELRERAEATRDNDAIFSDDPDAGEKLEDKIIKLEQRQELMKAANKLIRKDDRAGLAALGFSETSIERLFAPDFVGRIGFPAFELTNNNANIRRLKERLQIIARKQAMEDKDEECNGVTIQYRPGENRIRLRYPERVDGDTFRLLRQNGFRVLRSEGEGAFSAYYNNNALWFIKTQIKKEG